MVEDGTSHIKEPNEFYEAEGEESAFQRGIYDFVPNIIYVYDVNKKQLSYVNKKITEVLGYSYEDIKSWGNDFTKVVFPDDLDLVLKELEKCNELKDEVSHAYKCRFNCKEGNWRHFHVTGKVLKRDKNGKAALLLFVAQDVTERLESTEETKNLKELTNETEELLRFGTWTLDIKTGDMKWSKGIYTLLNYEKKDLPEASKDQYLKHLVDEDVPIIEAAIANAIKNKEHFEKEYSIITANGDEKRVYSKAKVILNENSEVVKMLGITRCITEFTQLYHSLANYKQMAMEKEEFLGHGSWEINYTDNTIIWSDGMYRLFGYDPKEEKNKLVINEQLYRLHMSEENFKRFKIDQREEKTTDNNYTSEYEIRTVDGTLKKLESFGKMIRNRKGKPIQLIGTTRDVTQLRNYELELEKKITELKRSNKDLEDFAYIASHDIQEPLRKIISFSERLKTKHGNMLEAEAKNYLDRIMTATKNARFIIDGLMDFSKLTSEGQSFKKADLNSLMQEVKTELELKIEETKAVITIQNLPVLEVVPVQVKQMLNNLILNAIKFKKFDSAPFIEIKSKKLTTSEVLQNNLNPIQQYYKIDVKDNGIGFEAEYAEKIFEMFQRLHSKTDYPGAGIGLALCKKITENHNGKIFAISQLGKGTTFSVILPEIQ